MCIPPNPCLQAAPGTMSSVHSTARAAAVSTAGRAGASRGTRRCVVRAKAEDRVSLAGKQLLAGGLALALSGSLLAG